MDVQPVRGRTPTRRRSEHIVTRTLVDVCMTQPTQLPLSDQARTVLVEAARHHRVAPLVHAQLSDADEAVAGALRADRDTAKKRFLASTMLLNGLHDLLGDIPWLAFKGPVLSEHAHPVPGIRWFNDVDILVSPSRLRDVTMRLLDAGWRTLDHSENLTAPDPPGEMNWLSPGGVAIDLHWSMLNMPRVRRRYPLVTDRLLADRVRVPVGLASTWTLAPADMLVHVCLHAAKTGANRMQMLLDADQLARRVSSWDAVVAQAHTWGAAPAVAMVLSRSRSVLNTPTPADLEQRLGTSAAFRGLNRVVNRVSSVPSLRRDPSLARLVARSARPGDFQTLRTVTGRSMEGAIYRLRSHEPRDPWDPRRVADSAAIEVFVTAVEREVAVRAEP